MRYGHETVLANWISVIGWNIGERWSLKKILTEVLLYWSIQLLSFGFLIKYVS
jgi:hypothetical protein